MLLLPVAFHAIPGTSRTARASARRLRTAGGQHTSSFHGRPMESHGVRSEAWRTSVLEEANHRVVLAVAGNAAIWGVHAHVHEAHKATHEPELLHPRLSALEP